MKYYIIAGEASGDMHAAHLIHSLKKRDAQVDIRGWGGDRMEAAGAEIVKHYRELAFMGFVEVLLNIRTISKNISFCKQDILLFQPDVLILVDYPGFNLRIAGFAHKKGIKVVYYISPQVWAWKKSRVHKIKKVVDSMLVILPFEKKFYATYGIEVAFVGHPLLDELREQPKVSRETFLQTNKLADKPIVALLPGSRKQEISKMLHVMLQVVGDYPDYQFVIGGLSSVPHGFYRQFTGQVNCSVVFDQTGRLLQHAEAALVTSGTATLETALMDVPEVVCYKANPVSVAIARKIIKVKYISLVNLIMEKEIVKELIQQDLNRKSLSYELGLLLRDETKRKKIMADYQSLREKLGKAGASERAADLIVGS